MNQQLNGWGMIFVSTVVLGSIIFVGAWPFIAMRLLKFDSEKELLLTQLKMYHPELYLLLIGNKNKNIPIIGPISDWQKFRQFLLSKHTDVNITVLERINKCAKSYNSMWFLLRPVLVLFTLCISIMFFELLLLSLGVIRFSKYW